MRNQSHCSSMVKFIPTQPINPRVIQFPSLQPTTHWGLARKYRKDGNHVGENGGNCEDQYNSREVAPGDPYLGSPVNQAWCRRSETQHLLLPTPRGFKECFQPTPNSVSPKHWKYRYLPALRKPNLRNGSLL